MSGYVRIHRSLIGHPAFRNDAEAMAFAWLVAKAAWKPTRVRYKERAVSLARGQVAISQRDMARALDRDKAWIERLWKRLKAEAMIEVDSEAGVAVITICNYATFQPSAEKREAADEAQHEAGARQGQGTEQVREEVKEGSSEAKASSPRPWALPVGVSLQTWTDFLTNRKRKRLVNTPSTWKTFQDDLRRVSSQTGIPPPKLIELCTGKGWGGIYDPQSNGHSNDRPDNPTAIAVQRLTGAFGAHH